MLTIETVLASLNVSFFYCLFCYSLQAFFGWAVNRISDDVASKEIKVQTASRAVSSIHAVIMFSLTAYYWLRINPDVVYIKGGAYENRCIDLMLGYLYYDIVQEIKETCQADTIAHHVMGFLSHAFTRFDDCDAAYFYTMVVYLAEASTPFLHTCWILHTYKLGAHPIFLPLSAILIILFFVFRVVVGGYIIWHLWTDSIGWQGKLANEYVNTVILVLFVGLNYFWFFKLIQMATGIGKKKKQK